MEVASGILNFAGTKLASKIFEEIGSTLGVKKGLDELQEIVEGIKSVLQDFGHKVIKNDPSLKWLKILKDIAYDIDDLLNEFYMEAEKHKAEIDSDKHVMVKCFCEKPNSIIFRYKMANKIKTIKERYQASVDKRRDIKTLKTSSPIEPSQDRQLATGELSSLPIIDEKTTFGRDYDKSKIIDMLIKTSDREPVQKISIVGIGGSGKTTLSKLVFNDKNQIEKHFEVRIWVYVSQDFDVEKLIWKLYEAMPNKKNGHENFQSVSKKILETLSSKRFLLVLDDVWEKDPHKWNDFKLFLKDGAAGSRILLTTRSKEVAEIVKSIPYDLMGLSEDYGWELFQQSSGRVEEDFVEIGKELVKKCSGVPLALKALGWIVGRKKTVSSWQAVRDSELWNVEDVEDRVFRSLLLSYAHLPSYLQQCFVYCSIFPKGYIINKHHLIGEWIRCGFIALINEVEHPEEVGNEYFDSLLKMSFLQYEYDGIGTCKMHDLVHDLTRYILKDEIVSEPNNITNDSAPRCRYLSLTESTNKIDRRLINKVRALYVANGKFIFDKPIKKATCVRSVTLEHIDTITSLSPFILKTEYLGYLRISNLNFEALPDAISFCWNLQALHVTDCRRLLTLPESIGKLKKLRTLDLSAASNLESLPWSIGDCHDLQSLHLSRCYQLKEIPNTIVKNENLRVLNLFLCDNLNELPSESFGMLQNLESINLGYCGRIEGLPKSIVQLQKLHSLNLSQCASLVDLPEGIVKLTKLKVLSLKGCDKLCGLPVGIKQLTRLQTLGLFVVGDGTKYARISELENLDMINGGLQITNIGYMKGSDVDRERKAYLKKKNKLQKIMLHWSISEHEHAMDIEQEMALLNDLEPPSGIVRLEIYNYPGWQFSHWMVKQNMSDKEGKSNKICSLHDARFPHLTKMILKNMPNLKHLMEIVELPSLKHLRLENMPALESIGAGPFPSLVKLKIDNMPNLVELWTTMTALVDGKGEQGLSRIHQQVQTNFPCLSSLRVRDCPSLTVKSYMPWSLENLYLFRSNEQLLVSAAAAGDFDLLDAAQSESSFSPPLLRTLHLAGMSLSSSTWELLQHLTALQDLKIEDCEGLRQLPECIRNLTSLQKLRIWSCPDLSELPEWLGELRSLQTLEIYNCNSLSKLPECLGELRSLQTLWINNCNSLSELPECLGELRSLQTLRIWDCDSLSELPECLGELRSLQTLDIWGCNSLSELPECLGELRSLQTLDIFGCHSLSELPECLGELRSLQTLHIWNCFSLSSLPQSMAHLTSLQHLQIESCFALELPEWEWLGELSALQSLYISRCPGIKSLPNSIQRLTSLQHLLISHCPDLERRCRREKCCWREKGEDWHLISRIPFVSIL